MNKRILLAEDDENLAFIVKDQLELAGYEVVHVGNGEEAIRSFRLEPCHLCLIDVMMPVIDGFQVAEELRKRDDQVPILFLTARSMKEDRLAGFKKGGDDYITKPFSMEELLLRISVFFRRSAAQHIPRDVFHFGCHLFDYRNSLLSTSAGKILLTQKEADILRYFCLHQNELVKREDILMQIWGNDDYFMGRSLDVFIAKLRKYLSGNSLVEIRNVHGIGFTFVVN